VNFNKSLGFENMKITGREELPIPREAGEEPQKETPPAQTTMARIQTSTVVVFLEHGDYPHHTMGIGAWDADNHDRSRYSVHVPGSSLTRSAAEAFRQPRLYGALCFDFVQRIPQH
jgi:hypothetical protein